MDDTEPIHEPVESVIVGDNRRTLGKRLGVFALALLLLFFAVNGYIQSSKNGNKLRQAEKAREQLEEDVHDLSDTGVALIKLNKQLQDAIRRQNKLLKEAGFEPIFVPTGEGFFREGTTADQPSFNNDEPNRPNRPNRPNKPNKPNRPNEPNDPKPPDDPDPPDGGPVGEVQEEVCELTGICLFRIMLFF